VREGSLKTLLDGLKKTAKNKLEHCRNSKKDLYEFLNEFLQNFSIDSKNKIDNMPEVKEVRKIYEEISCKSTTEFDKEPKDIYLLTFLSTMRKKKKQLEREGK